MKYKERLLKQLEARFDLADGKVMLARPADINETVDTNGYAYLLGKAQAYAEALQLALNLTDDGGANE